MGKDLKLSNDKNDCTEEIYRLSFNEKLRHISISGTISWQLAEEFFNVLTSFESPKSKKPLTVYINSEGGDTYAMFKIYDHIKNSPLFITTVVTGCALSAGFIIFMAGDRRAMFPNAFLGFHKPTIYYSNNYGEGPDEAKESAFHQNYILDVMINIIVSNSNMTRKTAKKYFDVLTRINADTALKLGLAHQVTSLPKKTYSKPWH